MDSQHQINVPLETAKTDYMELLIRNGMAPRTEVIPVTAANGRVTAEPIYARICAPYYNASAMDGIALAANLTAGASEAAAVTLTARQYTRVETGDPLPDGCDAVIMTEDVSGARSARSAQGSGDGSITICRPAAPWQNIRQIGEDICAGEMLLPSFTSISPAAIGAMIAGGITDIPVIRRPAAGIIPVGDSLVPSASDPKHGEIPELNSAIFSAMICGWGAETVIYPITGEGISEISGVLKKALSECDAVILNTGSSADGKDHTAIAIAEIGSVLHQGLAIKPGKPALLGHSGPKPILGVPKYPVSGIIVIEQILRPIIEYLCHKTPETYRYAEAVLSKAVVSAPEYQEFVRVRLGYVKERLIASPLNRGSGVVTSFMKADGIVEVPQETAGYKNGEKVSVRLLRSDDELRGALVAIGSHDPLLDELSELLRLKYGDVSMCSAHAGSMGGLIAVRRGEAHLAGTHLLDEETGEYNTSFVRKVFRNGGVRLVECVKRTQGLMLRGGNPGKIASVADLSMDGLRYVNRQKGSGTRILIDYLCRQNNVETSKIYGYDREEYTHTSVAALIAGGSADAGLGIYSAARLYDLDFVPVCEEQYDLLIPDHAWNLPLVEKLLDVLKSDEFRLRLDALGGYIIENPGTVREAFSN